MVKIVEIDSDNEEQEYNYTAQSKRRRNKSQFPKEFKIFERRDPSTIHIEEAEKTIKRVKKLSENLDNFSFNPLPIPIGLDSIIGLIPWIGEPITFLLGLWQVYIAFYGLGLPYFLVFRMLFNLIIDFFIGIIPIIGDWIDTMFQANIMNYKIAKEYFDNNLHIYKIN